MIIRGLHVAFTRKTPRSQFELINNWLHIKEFCEKLLTWNANEFTALERYSTLKIPAIRDVARLVVEQAGKYLQEVVKRVPIERNPNS
jgi:hypothetical protein